MTTLAVAVASVLAALGALRWLRVAQREHYLAGSATRFALRWWASSFNPLLLIAGVALGSAAILTANPWSGAAAAAVVSVGPWGLSWRGRTSRLAWTPRLIRLALAGFVLLAVGVWAVTGYESAAWLLPLLMPVVVDLAAAVMKPVEGRLSAGWVAKAEAGLRRAGPRTVAITGSYGKTSTKVALAHLLNGVAPTVASPASFNNTMGLARAVNEHLAAGTEIFVAEMGTYGPGEIREMCRWVRPEVAVMTAIGPVHLERMGSLDAIAAAKREILEGASSGVLHIDNPHLARIADEESPRIEVIRVSNQDVDADVYVRSGGEIRVAGELIGSVSVPGVHPGNLACALGAVVALGFDPRHVIDRVASIPPTPHRSTVTVTESGVTVVDDTFNSNPAGARAAVDLLGAGSGRKVLVTPGMVELGPIQSEENRRLITDIAGRITDLVVVGRTNRKALVDGATAAGLASVIVVPDRESAVEWVRTHLTAGDAVLYENDLPDHYL